MITGVVLVGLLVIFAGYPVILEAHGGVNDFRKERAGPYEIAFGTSPKTPAPGSVHVSLRIIEIATGSAVPDAKVVISGNLQDVDGEEQAVFQNVTAQVFEEDPVFWDIDLTVAEVGDWIFNVVVEGPPGSGSASFRVRVQESSPITGIITIIGLVAFLSVVALAMRAYLSARNRAQNSRVLKE